MYYVILGGGGVGRMRVAENKGKKASMPLSSSFLILYCVVVKEYKLRHTEEIKMTYFFTGHYT